MRFMIRALSRSLFIIAILGGLAAADPAPAPAPAQNAPTTKAAPKKHHKAKKKHARRKKTRHHKKAPAKSPTPAAPAADKTE
jgi:hypothetical protein